MWLENYGVAKAALTQAIAYEEYESVGYQRIARVLQKVSREMIAEVSG